MNKNMYKNSNPKLKKSLSLSISKDKSLLDILDSVQEIKEDDIKTNYINYIKNNKKCNCCSKFIFTNIEDHQTICFQKKIKDMEEQLKLREEKIKHDIHIRGLELLIERNNEKWIRLYKII